MRSLNDFLSALDGVETDSGGFCANQCPQLQNGGYCVKFREHIQMYYGRRCRLRACIDQYGVGSIKQ